MEFGEGNGALLEDGSCDSVQKCLWIGEMQKRCG